MLVGPIKATQSEAAPHGTSTANKITDGPTDANTTASSPLELLGAIVAQNIPAKKNAKSSALVKLTGVQADIGASSAVMTSEVVNMITDTSLSIFLVFICQESSASRFRTHHQ